MTTILRPDIPVQDAALLTVLAAVAVVLLKVRQPPAGINGPTTYL